MSVCQEISPAERVWTTSELRREIFSFCPKNDLIKLMSVSKSLFDELVIDVWRDVEYDRIQHFERDICCDEIRYRIYLDSVRVVKFPNSLIPVLSKWPKILEKYPNLESGSRFDNQMVRREKYFFKDGKSKYRYTFEHLYPEYIPQSPIYGPIPLHLKKLQGVPKPWRLISKLHLRIEATGNSQQMQDMIKSSTVKKLTSTETEVAAMSWCTPISSLVGAEALEMVLEKGGKLPKTIHIRHYDENLPELLNTISSQLTDIAIAFNRANSSLDNMIRKMKWDRFRSLKRFRINCNRKDEEASSEDIDFSPDVNINALPLPKLVDLEIGVYYSSCNPIRLRTAEGMNVEIEWIRNIARTFKQIVPYYGRRKQPDRVFYPLFQRYSMYDSYPQYVEHHDQLSKAFESEVYL